MEQHSVVAQSNGALNRRDSHVAARRSVHQSDHIGGVGEGGTGDGGRALAAFGRLQQLDSCRSLDSDIVAPVDSSVTFNPGAGTIMQGDMTGMAEWLDAMSDLNTQATMYDEEDWYL
jgi:hypothetical protein